MFQKRRQNFHQDLRNLILNQNWICKNTRNSDIYLQKVGCFIWRIIFGCNSYHLSIEMLESHGNFVKSHFAKTQCCCKFTKFCKRSLEKAAYLVGILSQQSFLKNHTRGHFLFHKNIKDFAKTHEISYLLSNHWKFSFFERHVFLQNYNFRDANSLCFRSTAIFFVKMAFLCWTVLW